MSGWADLRSLPKPSGSPAVQCRRNWTRSNALDNDNRPSNNESQSNESLGSAIAVGPVMTVLSYHPLQCAWCGVMLNGSLKGWRIQPLIHSLRGRPVSHGMCADCDKAIRERIAGERAARNGEQH